MEERKWKRGGVKINEEEKEEMEVKVRNGEVGGLDFTREGDGEKVQKVQTKIVKNEI